MLLFPVSFLSGLIWTISGGYPMGAQNKSTNYRTLYRLNRAFDIALEQVRELGRAGMLSRKMLRTYEAFTQELQADINGQALNTLETIEADDWAKHGRVRNRIEKEIKKVP
jgi:hypothetical protein